MALNDTSGVGYFSGFITVNATPINIFGSLPADTSGRHGITDFSGALNVNISGGSVTVASTSVSGSVVNISGQPVQATSGGTLPVSIVSGSVAALSGLQGIGISGTVSVGTSGTANVIGATSGGTAFVAATAGSQTLQAGLYFQYALVSGATIVNIQSGASVLHTITVNAWVSGAQLAIQDSLSGNAGASVGVIDYTEVGALATNAFAPLSLIYDVLMKSGIVVVTSGATLNATVSFKNPV